MRKIFFASLFAFGTLTGTSVFAVEREPAIETPPHGLGLLLDTPASPVGDIYNESNQTT